jgi:hypothetical protein
VTARHWLCIQSMQHHRIFGKAKTFALVLCLLACDCANRHAGQVSPSSVSYSRPQFMAIKGTSSSSYSADTRKQMIQMEGTYYLWYAGWFASEYPDGPWRMTTAVPDEVTEIICARVGPYEPYGNYQLCVVPYPV